MNIFEKLKRSWWVVLSFLGPLNGAGFLYIGFKNNNRDWVLEGIIYEIPWLFSLIFVRNQTWFDIFFAISTVLLFISVIRSFWVAIKLADIYDNEEKYTIRQTDVGKQNTSEFNSKVSKPLCCICIVVLFLAFGLIALL